MDSLENTFTNFDLEFFLESASSLITENTENGYQTQNLELAGSDTQSYQVQSMGIAVSTDHINHNIIQDMGSMGIGNEGYQDQNMGITGIADHGYQTQNVGANQDQNMMNELSHLTRVECAKIKSLQKELDAKVKECNTLKQHYTKLTTTYATTNLQQAEDAKEIKILSAKLESFKQKLVECLEEIKNQKEELDKLYLKINAQGKQLIQYQGYVENLKAENTTLKKNEIERKRNEKDNHKVISALTSSNKISEDHLCLFGCVIEGRKQLDKNITRLIKKYCKQTISGSKKCMETTEDFRRYSVDTGRGSSLACSDGDGSLHSPAYTLTPTPSSLSSGATTPRNEQTEMTRDIASSPIPCPTRDISTNTDITVPPAVQTICDIAKITNIATNQIIFAEETEAAEPKLSDISIPKTLKEIVSEQAKPSQQDADNDREIKMILSKHRLNWSLLSPMTLSPEIYQVNEETQSEQTNLIKNASKNLAQILFGDEDSADEIDKILPESGAKRDSIKTQDLVKINSSKPHHTSKNPLPESNTKQRNISSESSNIKYELSIVQTDPLPECGPSLPTQLMNISDEAYTNPNPTVKRISRVKKSIATNPPAPREQIESDSTNKSSTNKSDSHSSSKRPADDILLIEDVKKRKKNIYIAEQNIPKSDKNTKIIDESVNDDKNGSSSHQPSVGSNISEADTLRSSDVGNLKPTSLTESQNNQTRSYADYNDINMFSAPSDRKKRNYDEIRGNWSRNLLNRMIYKYASKYVTKNDSSKCDEMVVLKIKSGIAKCVKSMPNQEEYAKALQQLVQELVAYSKQTIVTGLMKFVNDPARKNEFITNKAQKNYLTENTASKTEMALIDVIELVEKSGVLIWDLILEHFEFILFTLERGAAPGFEVVDIVAHFYAIICRFRRDSSRVWIFMLNAMYCLSFKAIPIIKHCLDVVPEVIPYANKVLAPGLAPLIRCMVFLLNFNSCDDPLRRVNEIRWRLTNKYHYCLQDENETTLLFLLRHSIINLTENKMERDMLELSFLIVAKRRGTQWSHKNIVQKILLPMIKGEINVSYRAKRFCITTIGFIVKPYNNDMVVHAEEVVNLLINMFNEQTQPHEIKDDIIRGLLNMNMKTIANRINTCLAKWNPPCVSSELEELLEIYVCSKNVKNWMTIQQNYLKEI